MTILKMNRNPLFLFIKNQGKSSPAEPTFESTLILNDQKEPLLRAFENHQRKIMLMQANKSNSNKNLIFNKDVSMEADSPNGILNFNSQSTEAESTDSTTRSSTLMTVTYTDTVTDEESKDQSMDSDDHVQRIQIGTPERVRDRDRENSESVNGESSCGDLTYRRQMGQLNREQENQRDEE